MKKLIAYSSISHMGFVTLGIFIAFALVRDANNLDAARLGLQGAMVQMISHGFVSGAMFSCVGVLYDRMHTPHDPRLRRRRQRDAVVRRVLRAVRDGECRLAGHQRLRRRVHGDPGRVPGASLLAFAAASTLVIGAAYTLWLVKRVIFGEVGNAARGRTRGHQRARMDRARRVRAGVLCIGMWPKPLTDLMDPSIAQLASQLATSQALRPERCTTDLDPPRVRPVAAAAGAGAGRRRVRAADARPVPRRASPRRHPRARLIVLLAVAGDARLRAWAGRASCSTACSCATAWPTC